MSTYNFSIYDMAFKTSKCYMWHEGLAKRGPNEIASFVYDNGSQPVDHGPLVSDRAFCAGPQTIWKIGYLVEKSILVQKLAHSDEMTFYVYFLFGDRLKSSKKSRIATWWSFFVFVFEIVWKFAENCEKWPWKIFKMKMGRGYKKVGNPGLWLYEGSTFIDKRNNFWKWYLQWATKKLQLLPDVLVCNTKVAICEYQLLIFWKWAFANGGWLLALHNKASYKYSDIYMVSGTLLFASAKRTQPKYEVIEVNTSDVLDFKEVADECFTNRKSTDDRGSLSWLKVK